MARRTTYDLDWHGDEIELRVRRAVGRATLAVGEGVIYHAKIYVHVETGDLERSIHTAVARTLGEQTANQRNIQTEDGAVLDAGSWLDYACVEEVGRGHQFMQPAVEEMRTHAPLTYREAFKQEGF